MAKQQPQQQPQQPAQFMPLQNTQPSTNTFGAGPDGDDVPLLNTDDNVYHDEPSQQSCHPLSCVLQAACCPATFGISLISSCFTVQPQSEVVVLRFGKYERTIKESGLHFSNIFGRTLRTVSTQIQSADLPGTASNRSTVLDREGNPLVVSAVVVFQYVNSYRAAVKMTNSWRFLMTQGESVLKNVISEFPYEAPEPQPSLRTHTAEVSARLKAHLQERVSVAGILVHSFDLKEISYAPVIAAAMLRRQQASAMVAARQTIVEGAVEIAASAVDALREKGIELGTEESTRLVSNLLTVICSESEVTPTLPLSN